MILGQKIKTLALSTERRYTAEQLLKHFDRVQKKAGFQFFRYRFENSKKTDNVFFIVSKAYLKNGVVDSYRIETIVDLNLIKNSKYGKSIFKDHVLRLIWDLYHELDNLNLLEWSIILKIKEKREKEITS
tara:strand:- start:485 stop:874 length:390 start_codon:yes stop_codon:yes gene_type:complete